MVIRSRFLSVIGSFRCYQQLSPVRRCGAQRRHQEGQSYFRIYTEEQGRINRELAYRSEGKRRSRQRRCTGGQEGRWYVWPLCWKQCSFVTFTAAPLPLISRKLLVGKILTVRNSHAITVRRGLWKAGQRQDTSATPVHVWQAKGQGRRDEGYEDGAGPEEGADEIEAVGGWIKQIGWRAEIRCIYLSLS